MNFRLERFPEYGVTLEIYRGAITPELLHAQLRLLREADLSRVVCYFDRSADLTAMSVEAWAEYRRAVGDRLRELHAKRSLVAIVSGAGGPAEHILAFWCRYVQVGGSNPNMPALFPSLEVACEWLDLPEVALSALTEAIRA